MELWSSLRSKRSRRVRDETVSPNVKRTGGFRRKRIEVIGVGRRIPIVDAEMMTTTMKEKNKEEHCDEMLKYYHEPSMLESLPHELLVKVVSCVDHDDLKQLFRVSRTIREATLTAKRTHFAYSTPRKIRAFRTSMEWNEEEAMAEDRDAPGAPRQDRRYMSRMGGKKIVGISVSLFETGGEEDVWPGRVLVMEP